MPLPKHLGIRDWIESRINDGTYGPGDRLPTEKQLIEQFAVSRNPVQRAMEGLVADGIVVRRRGLGTTVASTGMRTSLFHHTETSARTAPQSGWHQLLSSRVAGAEDFPLSQHLMRHGTPSAELLRLKRSATGDPLVIEHSVVSLAYAPAILDAELTDLATTAYYSREKLPIHRIDSEFHAVNLTAEQSRTLAMTPDRPVIKQLRRIYADAETCVEASEFLFHPHRLTLEVSHRGHH